MPHLSLNPSMANLHQTPAGLDPYETHTPHARLTQSIPTCISSCCSTSIRRSSRGCHTLAACGMKAARGLKRSSCRHFVRKKPPEPNAAFCSLGTCDALENLPSWMTTAQHLFRANARMKRISDRLMGREMFLGLPPFARSRFHSSYLQTPGCLKNPHLLNIHFIPPLHSPSR